MRFILGVPVLCFLVGQPSHAFYINGFNFANWPNGYGSPLAEESLGQLAKSGANWVALVPSIYMETAQSSAFVAGDDTPNFSELDAMTRHTKSLGIKVALKPHVNVLDGKFRGFINPRDPEVWFRNYKKICLYYARFAQERHLDLLVVGTELISMTQPRYQKYWQDIIKEARSVYSGPITYASFWTEWENVGFWQELDFIGVDAYFPMGLPGSGGNHGRLIRVWKQYYIPKLKAAAGRYGIPILFTEVGVSSQKEAYVLPSYHKRLTMVDTQGQAEYMTAFLAAFEGETSWFAGFFLWVWTTDPAAGGLDNASHTVQNKPALEILNRYFKGRQN